MSTAWHLALGLALGVGASVCFYALPPTLRVAAGHALAIAPLALVFP